jgi:hypothetical protein
MGPPGCPDASVRNYHHSLRNNSEERSSDLFRGGSLKSSVNAFCVHWHSGSTNLSGIAKLTAIVIRVVEEKLLSEVVV